MKKYFAATLFLLIASLLSFNTAQDTYLKKSMERGKDSYTAYCQSCHMENGEGVVDVFPPLAKTDYLKKKADFLIRIVLAGQNEEITVNGKKYVTPMAAMDNLSDEEVADTYNYVRNSWGNKAGVIKPEEVKAVREKIQAGN